MYYILVILSCCALIVSCDRKEQQSTRPSVHLKIDDKSMYGDRQESWAAVLVNGEWGYINQIGEVVIRPQFENIQLCFEDNLAYAKKGGLFGYIDRSGAYRIVPQFKACWPFREGLAAVLIGEKWGFIDTNGVLRIQPQFDAVTEFNNGLARVGTATTVSYYQQKVADVGLEINWKIIDSSGCVVEALYVSNLADSKEKSPQYPGIYDESRRLSDDLIAVRKGNRWGAIQYNGQIIIEVIYTDVDGLCGNLIRVIADGKYIYMDKAGRIIWPREKKP